MSKEGTSAQYDNFHNIRLCLYSWGARLFLAVRGDSVRTECGADSADRAPRPIRRVLPPPPHPRTGMTQLSHQVFSLAIKDF